MEQPDIPSVPETGSPPAPTPSPAANAGEKPLVYEETPVIEPQSEVDRPLAEVKEEAPTPSEPPKWTPPPPPPQPPGSSLLTLVGNLLLFAALFAVGVWLSTLLGQFIPGRGPQLTLPLPTTAKSSPAPKAPSLVKPTDPFAGWKTYQVISGATRQPVAGVSFKLPPEVLAPLCDGQACASQGTYLPGGTRFTVAVRGAGQLLADYRGALLTDAAGRAFSMKETQLMGLGAVEFRGEFTGITVGGYAFTKMRGIMVGVNDKLALEINHFAPSGVTSDFAADETLFEKILQSLEVTAAGGQKGAVMPLPLTSPTSTVTATPTL